MLNFESDNSLKQKLLDKINETGFTLEYEISNILEEDGWIVNTGKYYIDDIENKPREIDIIAYKCDKVKYFTVNWYNFLPDDTICSMLIISCKKQTENNICCFYTKDKDEKVNINFITNNNFINILKDENFEEKYLNNLKGLSNAKILKSIFYNYDKKHNVFASQVFKYDNQNKILNNSKNNNKNNISKKDDCIVYDSIQSLMKAMSYEIKKINEEDDKHTHYFINLLTVVDIEHMLEIYFENNNNRTVKNIDNIKYNVNYIVYNHDISSNIHFIHKNCFKKFLDEYDKLHNCNIYYFSQFKYDYDKIFYNIGYFNIYYNSIKNEFSEELLNVLFNIINGKFSINKNDLHFDFTLINEFMKIEFWIKSQYLYDKNEESELDKKDLLNYTYNVVRLDISLDYNNEKDKIYEQEDEINNYLNERTNYEDIKKTINKYFFNYFYKRNHFTMQYTYIPF